MKDIEKWGQNMSLDLLNCEHSRLIDKEIVKAFFSLLCEKIDMTPFGKPIVERFGEGNLEGLTGVQLIETSSITVHLDEVGNRAFIDIFSCKFFDELKAKEFSQNYFKAKDLKYKNWYR